MGQSRWIDNDQIQRKRTPSFPCHESTVPRNAQKQRWWNIINTHLRWWGNDWNWFSHNFFLIISSISTEQSRICVLNTVLVKQERGDLCWQNNLTHCLSQQVCCWKTPTPSTEVPAQEDLLQKCKTSGKALTTRSCDKALYWCKIPENSWSRTVLHVKAHWRVPTIYRTSDMSWVHFVTRWKINWPERLHSRENQNWTRVRSLNQLLAR